MLDAGDRRLMRGDEGVAVNARYLDALVLLVSGQGALVSKDAFMDQVWRGVPVTDEALTQCIRTLRRLLGDDATRPRFIETVPKHGYRFIAAVEAAEVSAPVPDRPGVAVAEPVAAPVAVNPRDEVWRLAIAGTLGAGVAGAVGGVAYGFVAAADAGAGVLSILLVMIVVTTLVAVLGGAGVATGIASVSAVTGRGSAWTIAAGAAGGMLVGAIVKLFGMDAFALLLGQSPGDITGAAEGIALGAAVGLGSWLGARSASLRRAVGIAGVCGAVAGVAISLLGGRLMGGSLDLLARSMPGSRLRLDAIGGLFGEAAFGAISRMATGGIEGGLFAACIVGAMLLARRRTAAPLGSHRPVGSS
ncbi:winged helix-turn-helix domain-containing protein [Sphingomonas sp. AX6]|uniref:winged helix-turn-helix domain-containing protein n=1 Tax=Sphingomonas sp. AX6 TaxID=2653171 RepID=UPI001359438B|nr:winged helix-turn-helix domain-containing protein [Sphingomonas sp. AX6]